MAVAGLLLVLLRLGWDVPLDSLWAEDGAFVQVALAHSVPSALGSLSLGGPVIGQRMIAELVSTTAPASYPEMFAVSGAAVAVASGFVVWGASAAHIRSPELRATLAALVPLAPVSGLELLANGVNVAWFMLFATFWVLLWRPASFARAAAASLFVLLTALSTPLIAALLPVAALRAIAIRDRRDGSIVGAFGAGLIVQAVVVSVHQDQTPPSGWDNGVWEAYLQRAVGGALFGQNNASELWLSLDWALLALVGAATLALILAVLLRRKASVRWPAVICVAMSVELFFGSAYARDVGGALGWISGDFHRNGDRYVFIPALLLISACLIELDARPDAMSTRAWSRLKLAAIAVIVLAVSTSFYAGDERSRGNPPRWSAALAEAKRSCEGAGPAEVAIPISPPGIVMELPCSELR